VAPRGAAVDGLDPLGELLDADAGRLPRGQRPVPADQLVRCDLQPGLQLAFPRTWFLAVLVSSAWFIAAIGAYYLLRRRALPFARKTMSIGLAAAALLLPIQLYVGDSMATYMTAVYQPDKLIAAEGNFNNGKHGLDRVRHPRPGPAAQLRPDQPAPCRERFDFHNFSGNESVAGLKTIPQNLQPTVAPVFWGFRLMIYGAWAMLSVAFIGVIMRLRRRLYTERWFPAAGAVDAARRGDRDDRRAGWCRSPGASRGWSTASSW